MSARARELLKRYSQAVTIDYLAGFVFCAVLVPIGTIAVIMMFAEAVAALLWKIGVALEILLVWICLLLLGDPTPEEAYS